MKLFKESKKQPIKFRSFKYIGFAKNYPNICYYYKELPRDNFEILTLALEGTQAKPEVGAGTNIKVLDVFMSNYLYNIKNDIQCATNKLFVSNCINFSFTELEDKIREDMINKYTAEIPNEIRNSLSYIEAKKEGFDLLYCSNDESVDRVFGIVNVVLVKEQAIENKQFEIDSHYTIFKPLKFMVSADHIKGKSKTKYIEVKQEDIVIDHELLV